jgi:hypothetical protein
MGRRKTPAVLGANGLELRPEELEPVSAVELLPGTTIERKLVEAVDLSEVEASSVQLLEVALKSVELTQARLPAAA